MIRLLAASALAAASLLTACAPCDDVGVNVGEVCSADALANDVPLTVELREACGTSCSQPPQCEVRQDGTTLTAVVGQVECAGSCEPDGVCQQRKFTCALPPLVSGTYTLVLPGLPSRTLAVSSSGVAACTIAD